MKIALPFVRSIKLPRLSTVLVLLCLLAVFVLPELAFAQDAQSIIKSKTDTAYNLVYTLVYGCLSIGLLVVFLMAAFGRMEWARFAQVCGAIVGVGCITVIIQTFQ